MKGTIHQDNIIILDLHTLNISKQVKKRDKRQNYNHNWLIFVEGKLIGIQIIQTMQF